MSADDIDPVSRCRLPFVERDALDPDTQAIHDMLVRGSAETIRGLRGPGGINLHSPHYAKFARPVGRYLRYEAGFSGRVREVAILITARCCDSQFEWAAHESEALKQGVPTETIEAIRLGQSLEGLDPVDAVVIALGRETFLARKVSSETYRRALQHFGTRGLVDLAALMGNYAPRRPCSRSLTCSSTTALSRRFLRSEAYTPKPDDRTTLKKIQWRSASQWQGQWPDQTFDRRLAGPRCKSLDRETGYG